MYFSIDYDRETGEGRRARSLFNFGAPINDKYKTEVDDIVEQQEKVTKF